MEPLDPPCHGLLTAEAVETSKEKKATDKKTEEQVVGNKCFLGHEETIGHKEEFYQTARFFLVYTCSSYYSYLLIAHFLEELLYSLTN